MTLTQLLPKLRSFSKIVVTGPQRSGTTIAAKILAAELQYHIVLEEVFKEHDLYLFFEVFLRHSLCVVQAPALSSIVHFLKGHNIAVVFMQRRLADVRASEKRIGWLEKHERVEKRKYFEGNSKVPVSALKLRRWEKFQSPELGRCAFELEYESLRSSPLWLDRKYRCGFGPRQTALDSALTDGACNVLPSK